MRQQHNQMHSGRHREPADLKSALVTSLVINENNLSCASKGESRLFKRSGTLITVSADCQI